MAVWERRPKRREPELVPDYEASLKTLQIFCNLFAAGMQFHISVAFKAGSIKHRVIGFDLDYQTEGHTKRLILVTLGAGIHPTWINHSGVGFRGNWENKVGFESVAYLFVAHTDKNVQKWLKFCNAEVRLGSIQTAESYCESTKYPIENLALVNSHPASKSVVHLCLSGFWVQQLALCDVCVMRQLMILDSPVNLSDLTGKVHRCTEHKKILIQI